MICQPLIQHVLRDGHLDGEVISSRVPIDRVDFDLSGGEGIDTATYVLAEAASDRRELFFEPSLGSRVIGKASCDPWCYAVGLTSGLVVYCEEIHPSADGQWLRLVAPELSKPLKGPEDLACKGFLHPDRPFEVRLACVEWVADSGS